MRRLASFFILSAAAAAYGSPMQSRAQRGAGFGSSKSEKLPEEIIEEHEDFNIVGYKETKWVCTKMVNDINIDPMKGWQGKFNGDAMQAVMAKKDMDMPDGQMFKKLFRYIVGVNSDSKEIEMTSPVTSHRKPVPGEPTMEEIEMCFWTGSPWQDKQLPEPIDKDVYIKVKPAMEVFVRRFDGWAMSREDWMEQKQALKESLAGRKDVEDEADEGFYTVGYDSPWKPVNRRNEIWIPRKMMEDKEGPREENLESPDFTVISENEKFELREYPATKWVCTQMADIDPLNDPMNGWEDEYKNNPFAAMGSGQWEDQPSSKMFNKLFAYIAGLNSENVEIQMTSPVSHLHDPTNDVKESQEMCFWLGSEWQDAPPKPISKEVYIQERPLTRVYVRKFGGFALSYDDFHQHYEALKKDLSEDSSNSFDEKEGHYYQVSYDSPFVIKDRHNEVWIHEKSV